MSYSSEDYSITDELSSVDGVLKDILRSQINKKPSNNNIIKINKQMMRDADMGDVFTMIILQNTGVCKFDLDKDYCNEIVIDDKKRRHIRHDKYFCSTIRHLKDVPVEGPIPKIWINFGCSGGQYEPDHVDPYTLTIMIYYLTQQDEIEKVFYERTLWKNGKLMYPIKNTDYYNDLLNEFGMQYICDTKFMTSFLGLESYRPADAMKNYYRIEKNIKSARNI